MRLIEAYKIAQSEGLFGMSSDGGGNQKSMI